MLTQTLYVWYSGLHGDTYWGRFRGMQHLPYIPMFPGSPSVHVISSPVCDGIAVDLTAHSQADLCLGNGSKGISIYIGGSFPLSLLSKSLQVKRWIVSIL